MNPAMAKFFDRKKLTRTAEGLAIAVAVSLPWSTSATSILVVLWLLALIPLLDWRELRGIVATPAGGLPVLLVLLGAAGMLWAEVPWNERWGGLESFLKLLVIPLLLLQFRQSERGLWVLAAYAASCTALLLLSWTFWFFPGTAFLPMYDFAVPVKNAATQSGEFVTCIFCLMYLAVECFESRRWAWLLALLVVIFAMFFNIVFVATGRTALVIVPVLLALFAVKRLRPREILILTVVAIAVGGASWFSSGHLRAKTWQIWTDYQSYEQADVRNSSGERIEFWKKSISFVRDAPVIGHGTGSIHAQFKAVATGKTGASGVAASNPHQQTFAVAIQLGILGVAVLWAMWIAHLLLFRGGGLAEWIGLVIVVQNIVGSLFNSHLFDFLQGWVYVFGVGVAGGLALKNRARQKPVDGGT